MRWEKRGLIFRADNRYPWMAHHACVPIADKIDDRTLRIYFGPRDAQGRPLPQKARAEDRNLLDAATLGAVRAAGVAVDPKAGAMLLIEVDGEATETALLRVGEVATASPGCIDVVVAQDAKMATPAQAAKPSAAGKQTSNSSAPIANVDTTDAGSPADATDGQAGNAAPQGQARADSDTIIASQSGRSATTRIDALAATPSRRASR